MSSAPRSFSWTHTRLSALLGKCGAGKQNWQRHAPLLPACSPAHPFLLSMTSSPFPRVSLNGPSSAACRLATSPAGPASPDGGDPLTGATLSLRGRCPCCTRHPCSAHSLAQPSLPGRGLDVAGAGSVFTAVHRTRTFSAAGENDSHAEQTATGDGVRDRVR